MSALDEQLDLIRFWKSPEAVRFATEVLDQNIGDDIFGRQVGDWTPEDLCAKESDRLNAADTYFIRSDMGALTLRTCQSRSLVPQPLKEYHLPTPSGFAYFHEELQLPVEASEEIPGGFLPIKAVLWRPETVTIGEWPHGDRVTGCGLSFYESRANRARRERAANQEVHAPLTGPKLRLYTSFAWPFEANWYGQPFAGDEFDERLAAQGELRRFMAAFWGHLKTTVYVFADELVTDRHTRRRAQRAGFVNPERIRVVVLRKKYNNSNGHRPDSVGTGRELTHRHIRSGHYRNQWYPKTAEHHQIWIDETVVGASHLPFEEGPDKIYDWRR
jgi:hypothetical protein